MCGSCNKSYISASGLRTHWKTTVCSPTAEEEAFTAERSILLLQQDDPLLQQLKLEQDDEEEEEQEQEEGPEEEQEGRARHRSPAHSDAGSLVMDMDRLSPSGGWRDGLELADAVINGGGGGGPTITVSAAPALRHPANITCN